MTVSLPYSRVVDVQLTRLDSFAVVRGFSTITIVQPVALAGIVDATNRTKVYSGMSEVAVDWASTTEAYKMAQVVFSQAVKPRQIKIAYRDTSVAAMAAELDAIYNFDANIYWLVFSKEVRDTSKQDEIAAWVEGNGKCFAFLDSNDPLTEIVSNLTNVATRLKVMKYDRSPVFYHTDASFYLSIAAATYCATRDFENGEAGNTTGVRQAYTLKFKKFKGIVPINRHSSAVQAISGFVPGQGLDASVGHLANTYISLGGNDFLVEGNVPSGAFIDEIHFTDWIVARIEERVLSAFMTNDRIPYDDKGFAVIAAAIQGVLSQAESAGFIASDLDDQGEYRRGSRITHPRATSVNVAQRRQRIAPTFNVEFRYAGAIHWTQVNILMKF